MSILTSKTQAWDLTHEHVHWTGGQGPSQHATTLEDQAWEPTGHVAVDCSGKEMWGCMGGGLLREFVTG